jgi:hypothetical protein
MQTILIFFILFFIGLFLIYLFRELGINLVINGSTKKIIYTNLRNKFKNIKDHKIDKYIYDKDGISYMIYHIHNNPDNHTIIRYHPILAVRNFSILNKFKNFNMIAIENFHTFKSINKYESFHYDIFEYCLNKFNLQKDKTHIHISCAYTPIAMRVAEKYSDKFNKLIIEEPLIDVRKIIRKSMKPLRFILPLLSKESYPNTKKIHILNNDILMINASDDKITNYKDSIDLIKNIKNNKQTYFKLFDLEKYKETINGYKFRGGHAHCSRHDKYFDTVYNFLIE